MHKTILLTDIIRFLGDDILDVCGNPEGVEIHHLREPQHVDSFTLDWVNPSKPAKQKIAEQSQAKAIIVSPDIHYGDIIKNHGKVLLVVDNPKMTIAKIGNAFFVEKPKPGIHPTAIIHPKAKIGQNVFVGANVSNGKCTIGDNTTIYQNVVINDDATIGDNVIIKPGAILGFDGFGFERQKDNSLIKFPQLGQLIIEDNVEVGANCCIDKGSLSNTVIGQGTKINNLCHIAHNTVIGQNVVIAAQVNISGSTTIEDNVWISPNASLRGHQTIGKGAVIGMGAVVTKNVPAGETWVGNPAKKLSK